MDKQNHNIIDTDRLRLRSWHEKDRKPFAKINASKEVCRFLPHPLSEKESNHLVDRINKHFDTYGYGLYALEHKADNVFIGFTGLHHPEFDAHFMPAIEIGWRLAPHYWNQGLATEAAKAVCNHAFISLNIAELVSFTTNTNLASRRVMEKIGMTYDSKDDFLYPKLGKNHPLAPHVLYRISAH